MFEWLERRFKSAYLLSLEDDLKRLRDENRQLVNSLLSANGLRPILTQQEKAEADTRVPRARRTWQAWAARKEAESSAKLQAELKVVAAKNAPPA